QEETSPGSGVYTDCSNQGNLIPQMGDSWAEGTFTLNGGTPVNTNSKTFSYVQFDEDHGGPDYPCHRFLL
ncbi:MAG: hypothetical protein IKZ67_07065, partial [Paludibacteraceae bacterium]|nr:hypothetical protein [Paludibacteraceae bacterium]